MKKSNLFVRVITIILTLCFVMPCFCVLEGISVSAALGTISGDTLLFAPPAGQFAAVSYVLTDGNNPVYDATFSLLSAPEGVSLAGNRLILNGSTLKSGDVSLSATSGDGLVTATLSVSISNTRLYFDAESNTTGEALTAVLPKLLNSSEAGANIIQLVGEAGQQVVKTATWSLLF